MNIGERTTVGADAALTVEVVPAVTSFTVNMTVPVVELFIVKCSQSAADGAMVVATQVSVLDASIQALMKVSVP